ncbi:hypothetical protein Peur_073499 [Populus x canadensis]
MEGTMDLNEHYKIGGSVYRAKINGRVLAVKKTKDDVTEELKILQKKMGRWKSGCIPPLNLPQALRGSSLGVTGYM